MNRELLTFSVRSVKANAKRQQESSTVADHEGPAIFPRQQAVGR